MSAIRELTDISETIRNAVMTRGCEALDSIKVELPASVFDRLSEELKAETINPFRPDEHYLGGRGGDFLFNGVKFARSDGLSAV